jgi:hypothetical protein
LSMMLRSSIEAFAARSSLSTRRYRRNSAAAARRPGGSRLAEARSLRYADNLDRIELTQARLDNGGALRAGIDQQHAHVNERSATAVPASPHLPLFAGTGRASPHHNKIAQSAAHSAGSPSKVAVTKRRASSERHPCPMA